MKQEITERVQRAKNLTEARAILKDYRLDLSQQIQKQLKQEHVSERFVEALRAEQNEVNNALYELLEQGGAQ